MLAGKILSIDKKFILVRAKIDQDIYDARHDEMHLYYESSTLQKIRNDCSGNLIDMESNLIDIYLRSTGTDIRQSGTSVDLARQFLIHCQAFSERV